ncbi:FLZ-type domain-containing protein [Heracleum sosnowskyi]|uniref:FLZ-type domain-containing protein n=1 Tax=Heracleum sosnowskyi TaxID=360622 RepID=A0AAD8II53_9APIA|nr:FLZ-type domain-containing protein [Heracleum sosnowskyi]
MVGLSIVLESDKLTTITTSTSNNNKSAQVINKVMMTINKKPTPPASPSSRSSFCRSSFLDQCFLCKRRLLPSRDIFMYRGDRAFCSEECRCTQIFMDEQTEMKKKTTTTATATKTAAPKNKNRREKCSSAAMRSSATSRNST